MKNLKNTVYLCEISAKHSYLALKRTDVRRGSMRVRGHETSGVYGV